jgi:hypothetical protein
MQMFYIETVLRKSQVFGNSTVELTYLRHPLVKFLCVTADGNLPKITQHHFEPAN